MSFSIYLYYRAICHIFVKCGGNEYLISLFNGATNCSTTDGITKRSCRKNIYKNRPTRGECFLYYISCKVCSGRHRKSLCSCIFSNSPNIFISVQIMLNQISMSDCVRSRAKYFWYWAICHFFRKCDVNCYYLSRS